MAKIKVQKIDCPRCKKEIEINVWDKVELPYDQEQRERVLQNTFYRVDCPECKNAFSIAYKCQYNDMERKYMLWVAPERDLIAHKQISEYNGKLQTDHLLRLAQGGYRYRVVRNDNELREKVIIFDEGLDDRFIETMKIVYVPTLKKKVGPDVQITGLYFNKKEDGSYQFVVTFTNGAVLTASVDMNIYYDMKEKLMDLAEENTPEGFCRIDAEWGMKIVMHEVDDPEKLENGQMKK